MPYEHPLIFGAHEYFWDDDTFHDDCIGIFIDERDCDEIDETGGTLPPTNKGKTCSTQTEPWAPPEAAAEAGTKRLGRSKPGMNLPNAKFRPSRVNWHELSPNSSAPPVLCRSEARA